MASLTDTVAALKARLSEVRLMMALPDHDGFVCQSHVNMTSGSPCSGYLVCTTCLAARLASNIVPQAVCEPLCRVAGAGTACE